MSDISLLCHNVDCLIKYSLDKGLIDERDEKFIRNRLLSAIGLDTYEKTEIPAPLPELEDILKPLAVHMCEIKGWHDSIGNRDLCDTELMGILTPRPSQVIDAFWNKYDTSPKEATDYYYKLCGDNDYIRRYRIKNDMHWVTSTEYGDIDITINLSKPEKDPKDIAAAKSRPQSGYPACMLCPENEGYCGRVDHPARQNHRIIPLKICGEDWGLQYSPYVYYNEHCILLNQSHTPMKIDKSVFYKLFSFVSQFPHYFIGSNADLPIVGGSILTHEHFQGGNYTFAMAKAPMRKTFTLEGFEDIEAGILKWPMSVIRIRHKDYNRLAELGDKILTAWRGYSDPDAFVFAFSGDTPHNTITPVARKNGDMFELDLVLRNNITTDEHPLGVYHPHAELHNIKKENIGLIEVMGLAVLPSRLKGEIALLKTAILGKEDISANEAIAKHADWVGRWIGNYDNINEENIEDIIKGEIGKTFAEVLRHAGVFADTDEGAAAFDRFIDSL